MKSTNYQMFRSKVLIFISVSIFVILAVASVFAFRNNNLKMIELRDAVFTADQANGDVEGALRDLRNFVYKHMNTNLSSGANAIKPPIQLKYTYERLVAAEKERVKSLNADVYAEATAACEAKYGQGQIQQRAACVSEYVTSKGIKEVEKPIPDSLYKFDFIAPWWSPDLAGLSLVGSAVSLLITGGLVLSYRQKMHL